MKKYHHCVKFTYPLSFQTRIPKVDQHTGGKWLIHGTKHKIMIFGGGGGGGGARAVHHKNATEHISQRQMKKMILIYSSTICGTCITFLQQLPFR